MTTTHHGKRHPEGVEVTYQNKEKAEAWQTHFDCLCQLVGNGATPAAVTLQAKLCYGIDPTQGDYLLSVLSYWHMKPEDRTKWRYEELDTSWLEDMLTEEKANTRLFERRNGISFLECLEVCLLNNNFRGEWERLSGKHLVARSPIYQAIDEATGYDMAVMQEFADFVYTLVFCTFAEDGA